MAGTVAHPPLSEPAEAHSGEVTSAAGKGERSRGELPLGPSDLPEKRTTRQLRPGVTLTQIDRGAPSSSVRWVVELSIPPSSNPDPDAPGRAVQDKRSADALVTRLRDAGFASRAQPVRQPAVADVEAGVIGHRVRLTTTHRNKEGADAGDVVFAETHDEDEDIAESAPRRDDHEAGTPADAAGNKEE